MATGRAKQRCAGHLLGPALAVLLAVLAWALLPALAAAAETPPYEPNDAIQAAAGPLAFGQSYSATIESAGDRDFYYFYVTATAAIPVELTVQSLGGGGKSSDVDATILDTSATPVAAQSFIRDGESRVLTAQLEPQKYFVEVTANEGFGDSYSLTAGGGKGAFGPYAQISGRCASANSAARKADRGLSRAKSKLQRATARLRRSRYTSARARERAQAAHRRATRQVSTKRQHLRMTRRSMQPWCAIAP